MSSSSRRQPTPAPSPVPSTPAASTQAPVPTPATQVPAPATPQQQPQQVSTGAPATPNMVATEHTNTTNKRRRVTEAQAPLTPKEKGEDLAERILKKSNEVQKLMMQLSTMAYSKDVRTELASLHARLEYLVCNVRVVLSAWSRESLLASSGIHPRLLYQETRGLVDKKVEEECCFCVLGYTDTRLHCCHAHGSWQAEPYLEKVRLFVTICKELDQPLKAASGMVKSLKTPKAGAKPKAKAKNRSSAPAA